MGKQSALNTASVIDDSDEPVKQVQPQNHRDGTITIVVFLMTYVLMPRLTRALAKFIYPAPKGR